MRPLCKGSISPSYEFFANASILLTPVFARRWLDASGGAPGCTRSCGEKLDKPRVRLTRVRGGTSRPACARSASGRGGEPSAVPVLIYPN